MDARCQQVYNALFRMNNGVPERLTEDRAMSIEQLGKELEQYNETIMLAGDGAELCAKSFSNFDNVRLVPENIRFQHAYGTALAAMKMADENRLCSSDELMPIYLRLPQAERELKARLAKQQ